MGESTRSALRAFQRSEQIAVTGELNPRTLARLGIDEPRAAAGASR
jgi:peptidoglycan hydrolase-like protein with peptidoglycan-binding domain